MTMTGVVLAASPGSVLYPINDICPKLLLPVMNRPLVSYLKRSLDEWGVTGTTIISRDNCGAYEGCPALIDEAAGLAGVEVIHEQHPVGTAGAVRDAVGSKNDAHVLVLHDGVLGGNIDMQRLVRLHVERQSSMTIVVDRSRPWMLGEQVVVDDEDRVTEIRLSGDRLPDPSALRAMGVYLLSPEVLEYIPSHGHFDLKEQLIPLLLERGLRVHAYRGTVHSITTIDDYIELNRRALCNGVAHEMQRRDTVREHADRVWVEADTDVSPYATLRGPIVIGRGCRIEGGATVVGPTAIGDGCVIERGATVRESVLWKRVQVSGRTVVHNSVLGDRSVIAPRTRVSEALVLDSSVCNGTAKYLGRIMSDEDQAVYLHDHPGRLRPRPRGKLLAAIKRLFDFSVSSVLLVLHAPVFVLIAAAVKLDSRGPIFFRQQRCGKGGRPFGMIKFRTMVVGAHDRQRELYHRRATDGPMFKIENDPRVTRLGRFLRRYRMDEMPQLVNVWLGQMSLVGPRPLMASEMRYVPGWRDIRLSVKPGMTGLWQVNCCEDLRFSDWIRYDIEYVKRQSFRLDFCLLCRTISIVLRGTKTSC